MGYIDAHNFGLHQTKTKIMEKTTNMSIRPQLTRAGGIDIHKNKVTVCTYISELQERVQDYGTFTCDLEQIRDDFLKEEIHEVIIESTGIYWIALCSILTIGGIHVTVVNPKFIKNMPKEKTDKKDARWLCKLLVNGLVRNSFIVSEAQRSFRDLCRMRTKYRQHINQATNRIVKNLERRNIKLRSVVSNMHTKSAMDIVSALAHGETNMEVLIGLCRTKLKKKSTEMRKALQGVITQHDRCMLGQQLDDITQYEKQIAEIEDQIKVHVSQVNKALIEQLQEIPGIGPQSTEIILAEIGTNVDAFSNEDKLAAWVGLAPGNKESAGKSYYSGRRDGNVYLRTAMLQVAWSAVRCKNSYWRALFYHLSRRLHKSKAIVAIARKLIRIIYKVIKGRLIYKEYGADYFIEKIHNQQIKRQGGIS